MASNGFSNGLSSDERVLETIFNPEHPIVDCTPPIPVNVPDPVIVSEEIKEIEKTAIKLAEQGDLSGALSNLDRVTQMAPYYPSGFNNRAQVYRLLNKVDEAVADLNTAIELSKGYGKAAEQAYTQRGLILMLHGNEDDALEDFKAAARLGNKFAQSQVVKLNPYAKLCNRMLSKAFDKLKEGVKT